MQSINLSVTGFEKSISTIKNSVDVEIHSLATSYKEKLHCLVSKTITQNIPSNSFSKKDVGIPKNIRLADEEFNVSRPIDLLIGAEIFLKTLCVGQIKAESIVLVTS
jgi:hypothetical protein